MVGKLTTTGKHKTHGGAALRVNKRTVGRTNLHDGRHKDVHFARSRDHSGSLFLPVFRARTLLDDTMRRAWTLFKTIYNHTNQRTSLTPCARFKRFLAPPRAPLRGYPIRLCLSLPPPPSSISLYLPICLSLSLSLASDQRGFSARTRRRGSIIHHTNSAEAGER